MPAHEGEVAVRRRTGVHRDELGSASVGVRMPAAAREFLRQQRMIVVGAPDDSGAVWASALTGRPGFAAAVGERTVRVDALPSPDDPLAGLLDRGRDVGMIALEAATRRRMRVNGTVRRDGAALLVTAHQSYANCPKYIHPRVVAPDGTDGRDGPVTASRSAGVTPAEADLVDAADTFFVATHAPGHGADASHRGGEPGFVALAGPRRLWWPDYRGNQMYMTLGNIELNPACGLLFVDWRTGGTLHLTGRAHVDWDPRRAAAVPGAERVIDFDIDAVLWLSGGGRPRWVDVP